MIAHSLSKKKEKRGGTTTLQGSRTQIDAVPYAERKVNKVSKAKRKWKEDHEVVSDIGKVSIIRVVIHFCKWK